MGLYAVVGFALVMVLTVLVVFAHRPHTPELVPGKPPSPIAWLDFSQPS
jgi:hypothetical protein